MVLRGWRAEDLAPFAALNADPAVMEFMPKRLTREESDAFANLIPAEAAVLTRLTFGGIGGPSAAAENCLPDQRTSTSA